MTAKEYLEQIKEYETRIKQKQIQLECLRETAGGASGIRYDKERIQVSVMADAVERAVITVMELEDQIFVEKVRLETLRAQIITQIHDVGDDRYIKVLFKRYVEHKSYELISVECHYSYDYVKELHSDALRSFAKIVDMEPI